MIWLYKETIKHAKGSGPNNPVTVGDTDSVSITSFHCTGGINPGAKTLFRVFFLIFLSFQDQVDSVVSAFIVLDHSDSDHTVMDEQVQPQA